MTDYLTRLAECALGVGPRVEPLIAPRFAPGPDTPAQEPVPVGLPTSQERETALPFPLVAPRAGVAARLFLGPGPDTPVAEPVPADLPTRQQGSPDPTPPPLVAPRAEFAASALLAPDTITPPAPIRAPERAEGRSPPEAL